MGVAKMWNSFKISKVRFHCLHVCTAINATKQPHIKNSLVHYKSRIYLDSTLICQHCKNILGRLGRQACSQLFIFVKITCLVAFVESFCLIASPIGACVDWWKTQSLLVTAK